jgi:hypothetical protein
LDLSMNDEDYAVNSTVRRAKGVAIISVLTSLVVAVRGRRRRSRCAARLALTS